MGNTKTQSTDFRMADDELRGFKLFAGNSHPDLAQKIAEHLGIEVGEAVVDRFNDGEINIQIKENIRNSDVFVLQSTCAPVNDNLMELFLLIRCLKRSSARYVTAVIPYYGYARQDRKNKARVPISASDVAMLLEAAGVDRVVAIDLHCGQIQGFFHSAPVDNLFASIVLVPYFAARTDLENVVIVSPDAGGVSRAKSFMNGLVNNGMSDIGFAMIIKQRADAGVVKEMNIVGAEAIVDADCVIVDDIADTCGTLCKAAQHLIDAGARRVFAAIAHPVFSKNAVERIVESSLTEVVVTDTISHEDLPEKIKVISVASLLGDAIQRIHSGDSISKLFETV